MPISAITADGKVYYEANEDRKKKVKGNYHEFMKTNFAVTHIYFNIFFRIT